MNGLKLQKLPNAQVSLCQHMQIFGFICSTNQFNPDCLCGVSHVLHISTWASSRFSGFLLLPNKHVGGLASKIAPRCDGMVLLGQDLDRELNMNELKL